MRNLYCEACGSKVYFQNSVCLNCGSQLGFSVEKSKMLTLAEIPGDDGPRPCKNRTDFANCNWIVDTGDENAYCVSCRLTEIAPNLGNPENLAAWTKIEEEKRRLVYNLYQLGLRPVPKSDTCPDGLSFRFLADAEGAEEERVLTGHANGVVTLNIAEADDVEREKTRKAMGEPYRTLLGHLRHEVGHYYWELLVGEQDLDAFRLLFGDESQDYGEALKRHYQEGAPADWSTRHISAYAAAHPWEDWAETWAHYLHMMDSIGTAYYSRLSVEAAQDADPEFSYDDLDLACFDSVIRHWPAVACLINSFNRSLGMPDAYPFAIAAPVVEKLRFIHALVQAKSGE